MNRKNIGLKTSAIIILCILATSAMGITLAAIQNRKTVPSSASIRGVGVGVYWNSACTNQTSSINWGMLDPGTSETMTIYIRNEGNTRITLSDTTQNWNPSASSSYVTMNWDYSGQTLNPNQVLTVSLTLSVSSTISNITSLTFDITITASG